MCLVLLSSWGCSTMPSTATTPLLGNWGGDGIAMTVDSAGADFQFNCAHGDISGLLVADSAGHINRVGAYVRDHGGPIVQGSVPDSHPASYTGSVAGANMTLTIRLIDSGDVIGTFTLTQGAAGRVVACVLPLASSLAGISHVRST
jgi:hypothetical protein